MNSIMLCRLILFLVGQAKSLTKSHKLEIILYFLCEISYKCRQFQISNIYNFISLLTYFAIND